MNYRQREDAVLDYIDEHPGCTGGDVVRAVGDRAAHGDLRRMGMRGRVVVDDSETPRRYWPICPEDKPRPGICGYCNRPLEGESVAESRETTPGGPTLTWMHHPRCWLEIVESRAAASPESLMRLTRCALRLGRGARRGAE
jgi:hypothetical protein